MCPIPLCRSAALFALATIVLICQITTITVHAFGVKLPICIPQKQSYCEGATYDYTNSRKTVLRAKSEQRSSADLNRRESLIEEFLIHVEPDRHDLFWLDRYIDLEHYKRAHGDCLVPQKYPENQQLGNWVYNQRRNYRYLVQTDNPHREKTKQESSLEKRKWRIELFERIGFDFREKEWNDVWEERFDELLKYKDEHGDCNVPRGYKKNRKLGIWVVTQRTEYWLKQDGKEHFITDARIKKLEGIGFEWSVQVPWEERFEELKEFKKRFNHCNVPQHSEENYQLGQWVHTQRKQYRLMQEGKESSMTEERIELLESIGFKWYVNVPWEKRFEELKEFKKCFNHCNVPIRWGENYQLGQWVHTQRKQYRLMQEGKESSMTEERINLLESIGFEWTLRKGKGS